MCRAFYFLIFISFSLISHAEDIPNINAEGMKKIHGVIRGIDQVETSENGKYPSTSTGDPLMDLGSRLLGALFGTNYVGFPIYHVNVNEKITLEVASREKLQMGDCVLVWYDEAMGDTPNLSMLGQAGISKNQECNK